jgi:NAD(P)-dependent dehydrogenase (short-subunit alcohol dehydrogenase family)
MRFMNTSALVTGGGSGIGLACARRLASEGATVTIFGRTQEKLRRAAEDIQARAAAEVSWAVGDVADEDALRNAVEMAAEAGDLRIVVASAGTGWVAPLTTIPVSVWRHVLDTHVVGFFLALKHAVPRMVEAGGGTLTAISSVNGIRQSRFLSPYSTAKAGLNMLVRCAADELGAAGIRVNAVAPGLVPTELSMGLVEIDEVRDDYVEQMPLGRLGDVEEVAAAVCFLSSQEAAWITGACVPVDGGHHLRRGENLDGWVRARFAQQERWWGVGPAPR